MGYWYSRFLFERALAAMYLVGFAVAANQFVPLLGERGLLPVSRFTQFVPFRASPSLFFLSPTDTAFRIGAWTTTPSPSLVWMYRWLLFRVMFGAGL